MDACKRGGIILRAFQKIKDKSLEKVVYNQKRDAHHHQSSSQDADEQLPGGLPEIIHDIPLDTICTVSDTPLFVVLLLMIDWLVDIG